MQVNGQNPKCVLWDFDSLSWSQEGCRFVNQANSIVTCHCDYPANFAVLVVRQLDFLIKASFTSLVS